MKLVIKLLNILMFALSEATGLFALMMGFLILYS